MRTVGDRKVAMRLIPVIVCDLESPKMNRPKTELGCWHHRKQKNANEYNLCKLQHTLFILHFIKARL